jgi:hypothetical protein
LKGKRPLDMSCGIELPSRYAVADATHISALATPIVSHTGRVHGMKQSETTHETGGVVGPTLPLTLPEDSIPLPEDSIPLPEDSIPLPEDSIPLPEDSIPLPEDSIPLPEGSIPLLLPLPDRDSAMKARSGAASSVSMILNTCGVNTLDESRASFSGLRPRSASRRFWRLWPLYLAT